MAFDSHANFAYSTVATAPSTPTAGTSLVVASGDGGKFPTAPFNATIWPTGAQPTSANAEIVRVTAVSTDTLTITRAQESTSARTVVVGDQIAATITKKTLTDIESAGSQVIYANEAYSFDTLDGWNTGGLTTGTGSVSMDTTGHNLQMVLSAATTSDIAGIRNNKSLSWLASNLPLNIYGYIAPAFAGGAGSGDCYIRAYSSANDPSTATADQIGWHIIKASAVLSGKSSTGDGTTEQAVTLSGYTPSTSNSRAARLSFSWDGTTVSFYVDGVLKNSHTTNVPRRTTQETLYRPLISISASSANLFNVYPTAFNIQYPMFS